MEELQKKILITKYKKNKQSLNGTKKISNDDVENTSSDSNSVGSDKLKKLLKNLKNSFIVNVKQNFSKSNNSYTFNFSKHLNIKNIDLLRPSFPKKISENVTNKNNILKIEYDGEIYDFLINEDYYNRYELCDYISDLFKENNLNIQLLMDKNDNYVFICEKHLKLFDCVNSILFVMGFINGNYDNYSNAYKTHIPLISDNPILLCDNIYYLSIINVRYEPIFRINMDDDVVDVIYKINDCIGSNRLDILFFSTPLQELDIMKVDHFSGEHNYDLFIEC